MIDAGPSVSGNPWPRLIEPVRTASALISAKIVVPSPAIRALEVFIASDPSPDPRSAYDDAVTQPLTRTRVAVAAGFFLQGLVFAAIVTQTPRIKDKFDIDDGALTGILVMVAVVSGVGSVIAGMIAERRTSAVAFKLALATIGLGALLVGSGPEPRHCCSPRSSSTGSASAESTRA